MTTHTQQLSKVVTIFLAGCVADGLLLSGSKANDAQYDEVTENASTDGRASAATRPASLACQDVEETLEADSGNIVLRERPQDCTLTWTWTLKTKILYPAFVLQFHEVVLRHNCSVHIGIPIGIGNLIFEIVTFTDDRIQDTPLIMPSSSVFVTIRTPYVKMKYRLTKVNISYAIQYSFNVPTAISANGTDVPDMYNCSSQDVVVPPAFRCNGVKQCILGEDEQDCDTPREGCGPGWFPFRDQCLRFQGLFEGTSVTSPGMTLIEAEGLCRSNFGGRLPLVGDSDIDPLIQLFRRNKLGFSVEMGIRKVKPMSKKLRHLYRFLWQWGDKGSPVSYDTPHLQRKGPLLKCAIFTGYVDPDTFRPTRCNHKLIINDYVCMKPNPFLQIGTKTSVGFTFEDPEILIDQIQSKTCADGSLVQTFHDCVGKGESVVHHSPHGFSRFACRYGPPVHYSLVCDGLDDCVDGSDEMECARVQFSPLKDSMFQCDNKQLVLKADRCNGQLDCFDETDEEDCAECTEGNILCSSEGCLPEEYNSLFKTCPSLSLFPSKIPQLAGPAVVLLDGYGMSNFQPVNGDNIKGKFPCSDGHYIPSFLVNNGEVDCVHGDDENIPWENLTCPGFYRCHYTSMCVHPDNVCDGIIHCPNKDDERYCNLVCPHGCVCEGYAYSCYKFLNVSEFKNARYIDLSRSEHMSLYNVHFIENLIFVNLSYCKLSDITSLRIPRLRILDVSHNKLMGTYSFALNKFKGLRYLNISGNPLTSALDFSFNAVVKSSGLVFLEHLSMQQMQLSSLGDKALSSFTALRVLDIRDNPIESYGKDVFHGLSQLQLLFTDDSRLCCSFFHVSLEHCVAPFDELSSCGDLLRLDFYRVVLWLIAVLATTGNTAVLLYRLHAKRQATSRTFRVLITSLCFSDLLMGVYLIVVGVADLIFQGNYVSEEKAWKKSVVCHMAGFLGLVSSEVSALMICVITFDRLLVVQFPLKANLHMSARSAAVLSGGVWLLGVTMASLPLLTDLEFYGETSICLPLPVTRRQYSGQWYAFGVFIAFNFVLFTLVGGCQALIYRAIRSAGRGAGSDRRSRDLLIARRLFLIAFTDFCCWFPVCVMGLVAANGFPIPDSVTVATAVLFLPINSALNPFLYTLNTVLQKREAGKLKTKAKKILYNLQLELSRLQPDMAEEVVRTCVFSKVVKRDKMLQWLQQQSG